MTRSRYRAAFASCYGIRPWEWGRLTLNDIRDLIEQLPREGDDG